MPDFKDFAQGYAVAWSTQDIDAVLSFFTEDCVYEDMALDAVNTGKGQLAVFLRATFAAIPDFRIELKATLSSGDRAASEWIMSGTPTGAFPGIPATGRRFSVRGASMMELHEGRIRRNADYWSLATLLQQVGVVPETPAVP